MSIEMETSRHVDSMARSNQSREELRQIMCNSFEYFFGRLRKRRRDEVPSNSLRKNIIVFQILDQVDARREWLAEQSVHNSIST